MAGLTPDTLEAEIVNLRPLDLGALRRRWRLHFRKSPPEHLPKHLLRSLLAYQLQTLVHGDLDRPSQRFLQQLAVQSGSERADMALPGTHALKPGTVLVREHGNVRHHVTVLEEGLAWNGKSYTSLSAVAHAITGTRWNGRKFFGLAEKKVAP